MKTYKIHLAGVGGQGTIKASSIIGEAAMKKGINVVMSELHGMAQRGGVVTTEVKIGDAHSPVIENGDADLIIGFEPAEVLRSIKKAGGKTFVIMNSARIVPFTVSLGMSTYPDNPLLIKEAIKKFSYLYIIDAKKLAKRAGNIMSLNMVLLGSAVAMPEFPLGYEEIVQSMKESLPEKTIEINLKAFDLGFEGIKNM
ncbi:MAG: indolepyruvate ferredoxin oxidoreductase subunit beta [Caldisericota bacterium]|nr:indolepyruvate ferredoxin oxidoreductase subunit beta [Caldisericota bacterium]